MLILPVSDLVEQPYFYSLAQQILTRSTESFARDLELIPFTILSYVNEVVACAVVNGKFCALVFLSNLRV